MRVALPEDGTIIFSYLVNDPGISRTRENATVVPPLHFEKVETIRVVHIKEDGRSEERKDKQAQGRRKDLFKRMS